MFVYITELMFEHWLIKTISKVMFSRLDLGILGIGKS
jgi:hypothetical protein